MKDKGASIADKASAWGLPVSGMDVRQGAVDRKYEIGEENYDKLADIDFAKELLSQKPRTPENARAMKALEAKEETFWKWAEEAGIDAGWERRLAEGQNTFDERTVMTPAQRKEARLQNMPTPSGPSPLGD